MALRQLRDTMEPTIHDLTTQSQGLWVVQTTSGTEPIDYLVDAEGRRLAMIAALSEEIAPVAVWFRLDQVSDCAVGRPAQFLVVKASRTVRLQTGPVTSIQPYRLASGRTGGDH